uniref:Yos1-like protein n=1 Tax=Leersia perrieri TaxID=77586 RepID=A0A0D9WTP8_9ORYZ
MLQAAEERKEKKREPTYCLNAFLWRPAILPARSIGPWPPPFTRLSPVSSSPRGMGLWTLLEGFLLLANALAILNEDRFLAPRGWSMSEVSGNGQTKSLKGQIVGLIYATQFLRVPLIALNVLIIVVKLVSG